MGANEEGGKGVLVTVSDASGVVWYATRSPVGSLVRALQDGEFPVRGRYELWADQAGIAMAMLARRIGVVRCRCRAVSRPGLREFDRSGVPVQFDEVIDLVRSSSNPHSVCPIELGLLDGDEATRWEYLTRRYGDIPSV